MIEIERFNFIYQFEESAKQNWDSVALTEYPDKQLLYKDLVHNILRLQSQWNQKGIQKGEKIGLFASNSAIWAVLYFAIVSGGYTAVLFPTNIPIDKINQYVIHSDCKLLYSDSENLSISKLNSSLKEVVIFNNSDISSLFQDTGQPSSFYHISEVSKNDFHLLGVRCSDICTLLYTSGSMGSPKGVMLNIGMIGSIVTNHSKKLPYHCSEAHVNILPFFHIFGLVCELIVPLCVGMNLVTIRNISPQKTIESINRFHPKILFTVPLLLDNLINSIIRSVDQPITDAGYRCIANQLISMLGGNIEVLFTGGSSMSNELESIIFDKLRLPVIIAYGASETGLVALGQIGKHRKKSTGYIISKENIRIDYLSNDFVGEILVKDENIFSGYYKDCNATKAAFTDDGWFKTGDLGYIDEDGYLFITGRCKDMLLTSNGENIYPEPIEAVFNASPYITESVLVQKGHALRGGGNLLIIIVLDKLNIESQHIDDIEINKYINELIREADKLLPGFSVISSYEIIDGPLERTNKGDIKRFRYNR